MGFFCKTSGRSIFAISRRFFRNSEPIIKETFHGYFHGDFMGINFHDFGVLVRFYKFDRPDFGNFGGLLRFEFRVILTSFCKISIQNTIL